MEKDIINKEQRQMVDREKTVAKHITHRFLISKTRCFSKHMRKANSIEKNEQSMEKVISRRGNANN